MQTRTRLRESAKIVAKLVTSAHTVPIQRRAVADVMAVDAAAVVVVTAADKKTVVATSPATIVE